MKTVHIDELPERVRKDIKKRKKKVYLVREKNQNNVTIWKVSENKEGAYNLEK